MSEDVRRGVHAWLIRTLHRKAWRDAGFYSQEGATALPDPTRAPTLLLER